MSDMAMLYIFKPFSIQGLNPYQFLSGLDGLGSISKGSLCRLISNRKLLCFKFALKRFMLKKLSSSIKIKIYEEIKLGKWNYAAISMKVINISLQTEITKRAFCSHRKINTRSSTKSFPNNFFFWFRILFDATTTAEFTVNQLTW